MPIKNLMRQDPSLDEIKIEGDLVFLVDEVRRELNHIAPEAGINKQSLLDVVRYIQNGKYETARQDEIDLSKAHKLIQDYKFLSEKGCQSCQHCFYAFNAGLGETTSYCKTHENVEDALKEDFGSSPRIRQYREKGCDERVAIFKPIEEVLKGK